MAVIALIFSSILGVVAGILHMSFFDVPLWVGALTYCGTAVSATALILAIHASRDVPNAQYALADTDTMDQWDAWHEQEDWRDVEADSLDLPAAIKAKNEARRFGT